MIDTFELKDSFGVLSLLFNDKEKYKDHPVLKQLGELKTHPLYICHPAYVNTVYRTYEEPIPPDRILGIVDNINLKADQTFDIDVIYAEYLTPNALQETDKEFIIYPVYMTNKLLEEGTLLTDPSCIQKLTCFFAKEA